MCECVVCVYLVKTHANVQMHTWSQLHQLFLSSNIAYNYNVSNRFFHRD